MGDRVRPATGMFDATKLEGGRGSGAVYLQGFTALVWVSGSVQVNYTSTVGIDPSRVVPTGAVNAPRSWGALACVYLGHPAV